MSKFNFSFPVNSDCSPTCNQSLQHDWSIDDKPESFHPWPADVQISYYRDNIISYVEPGFRKFPRRSLFCWLWMRADKQGTKHHPWRMRVWVAVWGRDGGARQRLLDVTAKGIKPHFQFWLISSPKPTMLSRLRLVRRLRLSLSPFLCHRVFVPVSSVTVQHVRLHFQGLLRCISELSEALIYL